MTIDIIIGLFGGLLIFVAIVGGGFELRELKVPKVGRVARAAAAVVGSLLLLFAIPSSAYSDDPPMPTITTSPPPTTPSQPIETPVPRTVDFTIQDELGDNQITEQIKVHVDGRLVGTLTVDVAHPRASLTVTVTSPGRHSYTLSSLTVFEFDDGTVEEISGYGHGHVDVSEGKVFAVRYEVGEEQLDLVLE
jgi:hypothetical protein